MGQKSPSFLFWFLFISATSYCCENVNCASYEDFKITDNVGVRLYVPVGYPNKKMPKKFPLVVYYHGGGFTLGSNSDTNYHSFVGELVDKANVIALSVNYRLFNVDHAYDDSWTALKYVSSHSNKTGPNPTLNKFVNFRKIFLSGDSAGGNIAHNMAMKIASNKIRGLRIKGIALLCPYFWGLMPLPGESFDILSRFIENLLWIINSRSINLDDKRINPLVDPNLGKIGTSKILVITGILDPLIFRGDEYVTNLRMKGYKGKLEYYSYIGVHDFFLLRVGREYLAVLERVSFFFNSP